MQIEDVRYHVEHIQEQVGRTGEEIVRRAHNEGRVTEQPDEKTAIGQRFEFKDLDSFTSFTSYLLIRSILNRMLCQLDTLQGKTKAPLDLEYKRLCRQVWMCIPLVQGLGLIGGLMFLAPLYVSYEGGNQFEREYVLDFIGQVTDYKGILPKDRTGLEYLVLETARAWTGRRPLNTAGQ